MIFIFTVLTLMPLGLESYSYERLFLYGGRWNDCFSSVSPAYPRDDQCLPDNTAPQS